MYQRVYNHGYAEDFLSSFSVEFCSCIDSIRDTRKIRKHYAILRHDVDCSLCNALAMAKIKSNLGIKSSYFLLHPDGVLCKKNYFGQVENGKLEIFPWLIDAALYLQDLGHEVGLHNDLVSLWIGTGMHPRNALGEMLNLLRAKGINIVGTVAHGSDLCKQFHYVNSKLFAVGENYAEKFGRKNPLLVTLSNKKSLELFKLNVKDFDL